MLQCWLGIVYLDDNEYQAEVAARKAKVQQQATSQGHQQQ